MVRSGLGSAVLPRLVLTTPDPALSIHDLLPAPPRREIYLLWPSGRTQSPLTKRTIAIATEVASHFQAHLQSPGSQNPGRLPPGVPQEAGTTAVVT
ncbi:LysR family transcriptional regulator substrate-binding protein [Kribbella sp. CWNU-51]